MTGAASLATTDERLVAFLRSRRAELVAFAQALVATPSPNPPGDERAAAELVVAKLRGLGVDQVETVGATAARPNVIARVGGGEGRTVVLCGHLDTKPAGDLSEWRHDPYGAAIEDGELYGLGSSDMKGAVAAMVFAAGALAAEALDAGTLSLVLTADEEAGSRAGSEWLAISGLLDGDAAVLGEPCGITREWEAVDVVSRGAALFKVRVRGTQMHSSLSDRLPAVNATVQMARLLDRMDRELLGGLRYPPSSALGLAPTVNVGVTARAGVFYGVYPGEAEFACDIRTVPGMTREQLIEDLEAFLGAAAADDPELDAELDFEVWVPATEIDPGHPLVLALQEASGIVLGEVRPVGVFPGATDASHLQLTAGIPTVAAFGPGFLPRAHAPNESAPVEGIVQAAELYALAVRRYLEAA
ncbi:MAG TPA: M20/M25/M40 family metallo-hydrolase [Gaiellaceae bacterium]|nr:M20/M25/M40 family metallo-hydrolase [Gaiellaceae bacterium]